MYTNPELEEFARILMQHVRDEAIQSCDDLLDPLSRSPLSRRWRKASQSGIPEMLAKEAIPDIVNRTLFYLLDAVDEGWLKLSFTAENGKVLDLNQQSEGGHLGGWIGGGKYGWITKYSKARFVDDFAHIDKS